MIYICFFICLCFHSILSQQFYDQTLCSSDTNYPGTRYTCTPSKKPCRTFFVYRANNHFPTISTISNLFNIDSDSLLSINNNVSTSKEVLEPGHEILVPILCSCAGNFSQANFTYEVNGDQNIKLSEIACGIFQGLVKSITLSEDNILTPKKNMNIHVPLKCACPDDLDQESNAEVVKYLVTYPFIERDSTRKLSEKFNVSVEEIWRVNNLDQNPTVYPNTTVLVPLKDEPFINFDISDSDPPTPQFLPTTPVLKMSKFSQLKHVYIICSVVGFSLILALLVACGLYVKALNKFKSEKCTTNRISSINSCSTPTRSSTNSCLSPDLLAGIKYNLSMYTMEEIKQATRNFNQDSRIGDGIYNGLIGDNSEVMIKRMRFEGTRQVIDVHSKINHVNIVRLNGVCYGEEDFSWSYLVLEFPSNGSLRDCLSSCSSASLHWIRRTQIAFDIATGLHYLHYSILPGYTHLSINSKNIFLSSTWRAKLSVFGSMREYSGSSDWPRRGCIAPEHVVHGIVSEKVDIFAFGVVLLELISGKEAVDGKLLRESIRFLGGGANEGGCFDQLRNFIDPCLKDDYPLAEALCLVVLAGSCVEDDPLHRPSMDDVLKILARMV